MSGQRAGQAVGWISTEYIERVEAAIRDRVGSRVIEVRVTVRGGGLVLQGRSRTHHAKQLAQQAAVEFADWPILANDQLNKICVECFVGPFTSATDRRRSSGQGGQRPSR
jgi:osmotically-inducible protein OsmY